MARIVSHEIKYGGNFFEMKYFLHEIFVIYGYYEIAIMYGNLQRVKTIVIPL